MLKIHAEPDAPGTYLVPVSSVGISKPLDVVEDKPGERDDHQHNEGDGHEHH